MSIVRHMKTKNTGFEVPLTLSWLSRWLEAAFEAGLESSYVSAEEITQGSCLQLTKEKLATQVREVDFE